MVYGAAAIAVYGNLMAVIVHLMRKWSILGNRRASKQTNIGECGTLTMSNKYKSQGARGTIVPIKSSKLWSAYKE